MQDFRLKVNRGVRHALENDLTAKGSLVKFSQSLAREYKINRAHARTAMEVALSLDKGHRRRLRKGKDSKLPYVLKPFLRADDSTFHISIESGHARISLRNGEWEEFDVKFSRHHLDFMTSGKIKQLVLTPRRAVLVIEKEAPGPYAPSSLLALDTNERSLDGVLLSSENVTPISVPYPEVSTIQHRHFVRHRRLGRKKRHDRRVGHKLGGKEGRRQHNRVSQRLHLISKGLVEKAAADRSAVALEDLHLPKGEQGRGCAVACLLSRNANCTGRSNTRRRREGSR
jgi:hypothetical protein